MKRTTVLVLISLCVVSFSLATAQEPSKEKKRKKILISGYVKNKSGFPIQGVKVFSDNRKQSVATDELGFYKFKVKPDLKTVYILHLPMGVQEVEYTGQDRINFTIDAAMNVNPSAKDLQDVVNTGYYNINREDLNTSIGSVKIEDKVKYRNIYEMIQGKVPGVKVVGGTIKIRESSSITQSTEPLLVLNGVVVKSIDGIPPETVKSIDVLKGNSGAIYGAKGAHGVIVIKTK